MSFAPNLMSLTTIENESIDAHTLVPAVHSLPLAGMCARERNNSTQRFSFTGARTASSKQSSHTRTHFFTAKSTFGARERTRDCVYHGRFVAFAAVAAAAASAQNHTLLVQTIVSVTVGGIIYRKKHLWIVLLLNPLKILRVYTNDQ